MPPRKAVALVREGRAEALMKGSLHTDELMAAVVARETGLRTGRRISHCFIMDVPDHDDALIITDAAVNIAPDLKTKVDIAQNAIDLAHALGVPEPLVAILSAMETVNPDVPSTLEAAALCKMADRGQITGGILDGPLALDNAISPEAAAVKKIVSPVAGKANILVVPDLESGNMLAKSLSFLAGADAAGIVLGARVPIILTSRADLLLTRLASCAVALLLVAARRAKLEGAIVVSCIAVLNAGSSSIKFALYADGTGDELLFKGQVEKIGTAPRMKVSSAAGEKLVEREWPAEELDHRAATNVILQTCLDLLDGQKVAGVGHRVVHGGTDYAAPVRIDAGVIENLAALAPLAPLHQPHNLAPIRAIAEAAPDMPQVACFDTAFHRSQPELAQLYAIPKELTEEGVRRYGFHGLSYEFIASRLREIAPKLAAGSTIVCHLGNGASICALKARQEPRDDDGLHRGRGPDDGHPLRLDRSRRADLPDGPARDGRARARGPGLQEVRPARRLGHLVRHARAQGLVRALGGAGDRPVRLPHRARDRLAGRRARRGRRDCLHRRHRRE